MKFIEYEKGTKHASSNPEESDFHEAFSDCGLAIPSNVVVIDIDEFPKESIRELIKFFNIRTQTVWTDRGAHLYFKKPNGFKRAFKGNCALGFSIEQKTRQNSPNGLTVKRNGVLRTIENPDVFMDLPNYFNMRFKDMPNLVGLVEGEHRNDNLFNLKARLKNCEGWYNILMFVNKYVFGEPLDDKEFENTAREGAAIENDNSPYGIATYLLNEYKCKSFNEHIWWMQDGESYSVDNASDNIRRKVWSLNIFKNNRDVEETVKQVENRAPIVDPKTEFNIKFRNGVLIQGEGFEEIDYKQFTPYFIDINYHEDAKPVPIVDEYIDKLTSGEKEYRDLLLESLGFALVTRKETIRALGRFFIFRGEGGNGKGTLLQIMRRIFGENNCSSMDIDELCDYRNNVSMIDKLMNLGDDIKAEVIDNKKMRVLKNISTCDSINTRQLYHEGKSVQFIAKLYFTTNSGVRSFEKGYSYKRRVVWMPMFTRVDKPDPHFISNLTTPEALEYWIKLIVDGYTRLINNGWTESSLVEKFNEEYHTENNPYIEFIDDLLNLIDEDGNTQILTKVELEKRFEDNLAGKTKRDIRAKFDEWKDDENLKFNPKLFHKTLYDKIPSGWKKERNITVRVLALQSKTKQDLSPKV